MLHHHASSLKEDTLIVNEILEVNHVDLAASNINRWRTSVADRLEGPDTTLKHSRDLGNLGTHSLVLFKFDSKDTSLTPVLDRANTNVRLEAGLLEMTNCCSVTC